jgi:hypothetical protein
MYDLKSQHYVMYEQEQPKAIASTVANVMIGDDVKAATPGGWSHSKD